MPGVRVVAGCVAVNTADGDGDVPRAGCAWAHCMHHLDHFRVSETRAHTRTHTHTCTHTRTHAHTQPHAHAHGRTHAPTGQAHTNTPAHFPTRTHARAAALTRTHARAAAPTCAQGRVSSTPAARRLAETFLRHSRVGRSSPGVNRQARGRDERHRYPDVSVRGARCVPVCV